jgi:hypothetical protein
MHLSVLLATCAGFAVATSALATGPIHVTVDEGTHTTYASGANITIHIDELPSSTTIRTVRIWDDRTSGLPSNSVGVITLIADDTNNNSQLELNGQVQLMVKGTAGWNILSSTNLVDADMGVVDLAGITISNTSLARRTRLIAGITGNLTGPVSIGQLHRMQVGLQNSTSNGEITAAGDVTVLGSNTAWWNPVLQTNQTFKSLQYLLASRAVLGDITVDGNSSTYTPGDRTTYADVQTIVVGKAGGNDTGAQGIQGNILVPRGSIVEVLSTLNIGTSTLAYEDMPRIEAADGIFTIRAATESLGTVTSPDYYMRVKANTIVADSAYLSTVRYRSDRAPDVDGTISRIITDGNIYGSIECNNLAAPPNQSSPQHFGIFGDNLRGGISVKYLVDGCDIVGNRIGVANPQDTSCPPDCIPDNPTIVEIGRQLRGTIIDTQFESGSEWASTPFDVCTEPVDCDPNLQGAVTVRVGMATTQQVTEMPPYVVNRLPGFVGSEEYVEVAGGNISQWKEQFCPASAPNNPVNDPTNDGCYDRGSLDSIIRLTNPLLIELRSMTTMEAADSTSMTTYAPRVQCASIIKLKIDEMRCGTVWSGNTSPYAGIYDLEVGCLGAAADVYYHANVAGNSVPAARGDFRVLGNVYGRIHNDNFAVSEGGPSFPTLRIGGGLLPFENTGCPCSMACELTTADGREVGIGRNGEPSDARNASNYPEEVVTGRPWGGEINLSSVYPINGQVIVHASNTTGDQDPDMWRGFVDVGNSNFLLDTVDDSAGSVTDDLVVPDYAQPPTPPSTGTFGQGAFGLVPFSLHQEESDLLNDDIWVTDIQHIGEPWCSTNPRVPKYITAAFRGPIKPASGQTHYVKVEVYAGMHGDPPLPTWADITGYFEHAIDPLNPRHVLLHAATAPDNLPFAVPSGEYRITPLGDSLLCADLDGFTTSTVPVHDFLYEFTLLANCDGNMCEADTVPCGDTGLCDSIDFNQDSLYPDTQDIDDFLAVFSGGDCDPPNPPQCNIDIDFNNDGLFPDTADMDALLSVFAGGWCLCIGTGC